MTINRHNYEEYFILYLDNELSPEECGHVEEFARTHPDLGEELAMLQQTKLIPDTDLVYGDKEDLMITFNRSSITTDNYQEWLLLYTDNELTPEEKNNVEKFIIENPVAKQEFDILQKTKLEPEKEIVYFNRESLYRKEKVTSRVVTLRWWRVAAAAVLLLVAGISVFLLSNNHKHGSGLAGTIPPAVKPVIKPPVINTDKEENRKPAETIINDRIDNPVADVPNKEKDKEQEQSSNKENKIRVPQKDISAQQPVIAANIDNNNTPNDLPEPTHNRNFDGSVNQPIAFTDATPKEALTKLQENRPSLNVTLRVSPTYTSQQDDQPETGKTSKFRGLLRKVTRTFEKATNIKTTDENDRLLVAGLAIQL